MEWLVNIQHLETVNHKSRYMTVRINGDTRGQAYERTKLQHTIQLQ